MKGFWINTKQTPVAKLLKGIHDFKAKYSIVNYNKHFKKRMHKIAFSYDEDWKYFRISNKAMGKSVILLSLNIPKTIKQ